MIIRPHVFTEKSDHKEPWVQQWHGLYANKKYGHVGPQAPKPGTESYLEASCISSILEGVKSPRFMELGAGWGRQTLTIAGVKGGGTFYAVEAEPNHFQWLQQTIAYNNLTVTTLFGAMSNKCGWSRMRTAGKSPNEWYGQHIQETGNIHVPTFNLDYLFSTFKIGSLDLLHMDVQAQEVNVLRGGQKYLKDIKVVMIGIHGGINPDDLLNLAPEHKCILCLPRKSGYHQVPGFDKKVNIKEDGILVLERK